MSDSESRGIFREEALYYELGYRFSQSDKRTNIKPFEISVIGVLFFSSLVLQTIFQIQQTTTLAAIAIFYFYQKYANSNFRSKDTNQMAMLLLLIMLVANIYDHQNGNIRVGPGKVFTDELPVFAWIIEFLWVIMFGFQIFVILQPFTRNHTFGKTVKADNSLAVENYTNLLSRLEKTEYNIKDLSTLVEVDEIKSTYLQLLKIILAILAGLLLVNTFFWRIVGSFGGGNNLLEEYNSAGLALFLFIALLIFSSILTAQEEEVK